MHFFRRNLVLLTALFLLLLPALPAIAGSDSLRVYLDGQPADFQATTRENLVFVAARDLTDTFKSELQYDADKKVITITKGKTTAVLNIGSSTILVNNKKVSLDAAPMLVDTAAMLPAKCVSAIWGASVGWNNQAVYINTDGSEVVVPVEQKVIVDKAKITLSDKTLSVSYVLIPSTAGLKPNLVVAQNSIGATEDLSSLAQRGYAKAAINGSYFQSYDSAKSMDPYGILIKNGTLIHSENTGSAVGFTADNTAKFAIVRSAITVSVGNSNLSATLLNHTPAKDSDAISLFTSARGKTMGFAYGTNVIVENGEIIEITSNIDSKIPSNGFVLNLTGSYASMAKDFNKGDKGSYHISYVNESGNKVNWSEITTAVGGGPLLLKSGNVVLDPAREGFTDTTGFSLATARSALGITADNDIILVGGVKCTLDQLVTVMQQLGAVNAICLDGGSSSGTYASGSYVSAPSKEISNALVFK